jgi:hypothetical protein
MSRSTTLFALLLVAPLVASACGGNDPVAPTDPTTPMEIVEPSISGTLTPNGAQTHPFAVLRGGQVVARITALAPDDTVKIGLSIGTWNGVTCQLIITNDSATLNSTAVGTAQQTGNFCARVYDAAGTLTAATDYTLEVRHF